MGFPRKADMVNPAYLAAIMKLWSITGVRPGLSPFRDTSMQSYPFISCSILVKLLAVVLLCKVFLKLFQGFALCFNNVFSVEEKTGESY